jgi:hypothetical protein
MHIPRVTFSIIPEKLEIDLLYGFLFDSDWGKYILRKHPRIKPVLKLKSRTERVAFLRRYVRTYRKTHQAAFTRAKQRYERTWHRIEQKAFLALSEIHNTDWPKDQKRIKAMISINPICPRFLNDWSFTIPINDTTAHAMEVILHESCHFLYFKKWKELFPKANPKTFEAPHAEWLLSELVAPVILNDPALQDVLKQKAKFYPEHRKLKIQNVTAPVFITRMYCKRKNFDQFLRNAYKELKKSR